MKHLLLSFFLFFSCLAYGEITDQQRIESVVHSYFPEVVMQDVEVATVKGGYSDAKIYSIIVDGKKYILRLLSQDSLAESVQGELYVMMKAAELGVAPKIYYVSESGREILLEFIEVPTMKVTEACKPENIVKIAETMKRIHAIPRNPYGSVKHVDKLKEIYDSLQKNAFEAERANFIMERAREVSDEIDQYSEHFLTLHGDPHSGNSFLVDQKVIFIDWSETCWGDPFLDLTYVEILNGFNADQSKLLLESYLGRAPTEEEQVRYQLNKKLNLAGLAIGLFECSRMLSLQMGIVLEDGDYVKDHRYYIDQFERFADVDDPYVFYGWARYAWYLFSL